MMFIISEEFNTFLYYSYPAAVNRSYKVLPDSLQTLCYKVAHEKKNTLL